LGASDTRLSRGDKFQEEFDDEKIDSRNKMPPERNSMQSRNWVFTVNNPGTWSPRELEREESIKYMVWQTEEGENGTTHIQGYVVFVGNKRFSAVKKLLPRAHIQKRYGSHEQARDYCQKAETRLEGGDAGEVIFGQFLPALPTYL